MALEAWADRVIAEYDRLMAAHVEEKAAKQAAIRKRLIREGLLHKASARLIAGKQPSTGKPLPGEVDLESPPDEWHDEQDRLRAEREADEARLAAEKAERAAAARKVPLSEGMKALRRFVDDRED